ncbi:MAG: hypothetical protein KME43_11430 [Myxacorys chilensis ATA2-1-KO14]|jgi:hypothetical protein|nr:hypothetical protein [Myxacorys chilensis ATA2-1-KO14]
MSTVLSPQEYQDLIRKIGHLPSGLFSKLRIDAIASYLSSNLSFDEKLIDVIGIHHQQITAYFVLTDQRMICLAPEMKLFEAPLENVQGVVTSLTGFRVMSTLGEFKARYLHPRLRLDFPRSLKSASVRMEDTDLTLDKSGRTKTQNSLGTIVAAIGVVVAFHGFQMDTTVSSGFGSVHNIGLIQEQNKQIQLGGAIFIGGILIHYLGENRNNE